VLINKIKQSLLNLHRSIKRGLVIFCDTLICGFSVWLAFGLRSDQWGFFQGQQWIVLVAAIAFSFPLFIYFGLYRAIFRYLGSIAFISIMRVFIFYASIFFCIFTLIGVDNVPRSIGVIQPMLLFIGIGASRYFVRYCLGSNQYKQKKVSHNTRSVMLIYGVGSAGRQLATALSGNREILVKGFIDDDPRLQGSTVDGIYVYSKINLQGLVRRLGITDIVLAISSVSRAQRIEIISLLEGLGARVRTLPSLDELASGRIKISDVNDLDMNDLLGRDVVPPQVELLEKNIKNKVVLVTGAGGSIGSELCRQIITLSPKSLILIDCNEHYLYLIYQELKKALIGLRDDLLVKTSDAQDSSPHADLSIKLEPCLASVRDSDLLLKIFRAHKPDTVFHAAAYKHVSLVEQNAAEGIRNNVFGTLTCAQVSIECGVSHFILVSTDKAVRPTNVMGASKRIAELVLQALSDATTGKDNQVTKFSMVRFGNVLGSSGSVSLLFKDQIAAGGPITLTHPEVTRYFMTIREAAQLVIQACAMADGGEVFLLDMGQPVCIYDLAIKMVHLSGLLIKDKAHPYGDIEIKIIGLFPGEKLYEELLIGDNSHITIHPKIMKAHEDFLSWDYLQQELEKLNLALDSSDGKLIRKILIKLVPGYQPNSNLVVLNGGGEFLSNKYTI
jgi:FlaA1/EpsC-like NDP-sugar epimerase